MRTITIEVNENENIAPSNYYTENTFDRITKCKDCNRMALRLDQSEFDPCPNCGGKVEPTGVGKWDKEIKKWCIRIKPKK